jgi:hypothetical protein
MSNYQFEIHLELYNNFYDTKNCIIDLKRKITKRRGSSNARYRNRARAKICFLTKDLKKIQTKWILMGSPVAELKWPD